MMHHIIIGFAALGLGVPIAIRMNGSPLEIGMFCGGLNSLFCLIFK